MTEPAGDPAGRRRPPGDALAYLHCPHCRGVLWQGEGAVRCGQGHAFDVARHGYLSLLGPDPSAGRGDTAAMVAARATFLGAGYYEPLADAISAACRRTVPDGAAGCVVDVGAGTGYYLQRVLDRFEGAMGLALDLSRYALRRAASAHARLAAVACDAWRDLPVRSEVASVVLNVFAPRNGEEIRRILRPGGACIVVTPTQRHLAELVARLGMLTVDGRKEERLDAQLGPHLEALGRDTVELTLSLGHPALENLVSMGPTARHASSRETARRVARLTAPVTVTASFALSAYRRA